MDFLLTRAAFRSLSLGFCSESRVLTKREGNVVTGLGSPLPVGPQEVAELGVRALNGGVWKISSHHVPRVLLNFVFLGQYFLKAHHLECVTGLPFPLVNSASLDSLGL